MRSMLSNLLDFTLASVLFMHNWFCVCLLIIHLFAYHNAVHACRWLLTDNENDFQQTRKKEEADTIYKQ